MAKVNKIYPSFYNGISEQSPELSLDTQCPDMNDCIPDLVLGLSKRPPVEYVTNLEGNEDNLSLFHSYDRGEGGEQYLFTLGNGATTPLSIFEPNGTERSVTYASTIARDYLSSTASNYKAITVQDRTFVLNTDAEISVDASLTALDGDYDRVAYYWLKRSSGDTNNEYRYAVYIGDPTDPFDVPITFSTSDDQSDTACKELAVLINNFVGLNAIAVGSLLKIWKDGYIDFTYDSWDSWGNQASFGWKGSVNKLTDLPKDFSWLDTYVAITGDDGNDWTDYYVKYNGSSWEETRDPKLIRGVLHNMPISVDREADGTFTVDVLEWDTPKVGNEESNPDPSFTNTKANDIFFYKNRLGIASTDSVILSETGGYYNFYIKTVLDIVDTDPIDISIASNSASKIYHAKPFQNTLFLFTKDGQFELVSQGYLSPKTVSITNVSNYPVEIGVKPKVVNNSLFFISSTGSRQQLREYVKNEDTLTTKGIDLNISTPTILEEPITGISLNGVLGYVICTTASNKMYIFNYKESGNDRVQTAWNKWTIMVNNNVYDVDSYQYQLLDNELYIRTSHTRVDDSKFFVLHKINLIKEPSTVFEDVLLDSDKLEITSSYEPSLLLPDWLPHTGELATPKDKILLKKIQIEGTGSFTAEVYRSDYNTIFSKTYNDSLNDLDLHVNSRVGTCAITIKDDTVNDFLIRSVVMEGFYAPSSKEIK